MDFAQGAHRARTTSRRRHPMNVPSLNFNLGETIDALRDTLQSFCAA